jgi:hypothetical protein
VQTVFDFCKMKIEQIFKLIPATTLSFLATETRVDYQVKKLRGLVVFKLILFSMLGSNKLSLRVMESFLESAQFKNFLGDDLIVESKFNSIRDRISTINYKYFEKLFTVVFKKYNKQLEEMNALTRVDSTFVSISSKLMSWGMQNGPNSKGLNFIKFTLSMKGSLPSAVELYSDQSFVNDNIAMPDAIFKNNFIDDSIVVFDRGLQTRKAFDDFTDKDILFVGRIKTNTVYQLKTKRKPTKNSPSDSVILVEDLEVFLKTVQKPTKHSYRLCKYKIKKSGEDFWLLTNVFDATVYEIASLYKQRWHIETYFKFLKQHLNLKHIVSRNENAVRVMIYMTLILSILIIVYKNTNKIESYKIAKLKFEIELDNLMIKQIIILCGGNPSKAKHLWNSS